MSQLSVDPAALRLLAMRCRGWSDDLTAPVAPVGTGPVMAAAAAAVEVQAELHAVSTALANRMRETAALLDDVAGSLRSGDSDSASALGNPQP